MAKRIRKSTKITIISVVVALVVVLATVLAVLLTRNNKDFLTASQREFFAALHYKNAYSSNLENKSLNLGSATFDSVVTVYENYAVVKEGGTYKILSMKEGYAGENTELTFDGVVAIENDIVVIKYSDNYFVYKINYDSSVITETLLYGGISHAKLSGGILTLYYDAQKLLKVIDINNDDVLLEENNVVEYSVNKTGISFDKITVSADKTEACLTSNVYLFDNGVLTIYKSIETEATVTLSTTRYFIDDVYVSLEDINLLRLSGNYLLTQNFEVVSSIDADVVIGTKNYKITQSVESLVTNKELKLTSSLYFDSIKTDVDGYVSLIGDKISADKQIDFDDRTVYYYNENFELLISYDYDDFGDLLDYKQGLAIAKNGFIDVLGKGNSAINTKLESLNINTIILSSDENIVFAKNASQVYVVNIKDAKVSQISTKATTLVNGYMFVEKISNGVSKYFLVNANGKLKEVSNISTDENLIAYSKLSTGYYFQTIDAEKVRLVKYDGSVLVDNVEVDTIGYSLSSDKSTVILTVQNADGVKVLRSTLPKDALLPNTIDEIMIYGLTGTNVSQNIPVFSSRSGTEDISVQRMGTNYTSDDAGIEIKTTGTNIVVESYAKYLMTNIKLSQYNDMNGLVVDYITDTTIAPVDVVSSENSFDELGAKFVEITKEDRTYYDATINYTMRARNLKYEMQNNETVTVKFAKIYYTDVYSETTIYNENPIEASAKRGYIFDGYFLSYNSVDYRVTTGTMLNIDDGIKGVLMPTNSEDDNIETVYSLKPIFTPITYGVKYIATPSDSSLYPGLAVNGNNEILDTKAYTYDAEQALYGETFYSTGLTQIGWTTSSTGTTVEYELGENVTDLSYENGDIVNLYAVWAYNTYKIIFNANINSGESVFEDNGYSYTQRNQTITMLDSELSVPKLYAFSEELGYMDMIAWSAYSDGLYPFVIGKEFFDEVENGSVYTKNLVSDEGETREYEVFVFAIYNRENPITANFTYSSTLETGGLDASVYKAFNLSSGDVYEMLKPIESITCYGEGYTNIVSVEAQTLNNIKYGSNIEFVLDVNSNAAYIKEIVLSYYVNSELKNLTVTGSFDQTTGVVTYTGDVDNEYVAVVTSADDGKVVIKLKSVKPNFNLNNKTYTLGDVSAVVSLKEYNKVSAKLNGSDKNVSYIVMPTATGDYSYSDKVFYGRAFDVTLDAPNYNVFKSVTINGTAYDLTFLYTADRNDLFISNLIGDKEGGSIFYNKYEIDGLTVKIGFDGTKFYIKISGQITKDIKIDAVAEEVSSSVSIKGTNNSGDKNGISFSGLTLDTFKPNNRQTVIFNMVNGYRIKQINLTYDSVEIEGFKIFDYDNWKWDQNKGYYTSSESYESGYISTNSSLKNTNIQASSDGTSITLARIWFDLEIEVVYERVVDIVIDIDDSSRVNIYDQNSNVLVGEYINGKYKLRIVGNEDITDIEAITTVGDEIYYINNVEIPEGMAAATVTNKVSATWNSYDTSYIALEIGKFAITMNVTTYLGKGGDSFDEEHLRDAGNYYTKDYISFSYGVDSVLNNKTYGGLNPENSKVSISYDSKIFTMTMKDTNGAYKGYLAYKYLLKDSNGVVIQELSDISAEATMTFELTNEMIESFNNRYMLEIYFKAIEYDVEYVAGTFDVDGDRGNVTGGTVSKTHHIFNVSQNVSSQRFSRPGWEQTGWVSEVYTITRDGKSAEVVADKNLTNENGATVTLYAAWKTKSYTVSYLYNYGTGSSEAETEYNGSETVKYLFNCDDLQKINRDGYKFLGWFTGPNNGDKKVNDKVFSFDIYTELVNAGRLNTDSSTIELTAQWEMVTYIVKFNFNDADENGSSTATLKTGNLDFTVAFDTAFGMLPTLERTGYDFVGWAPTTAGDLIITSNSTVLDKTLFDSLTGDNKDEKEGANLDLFAIWSKQQFTIIFDLNNTGLPGYGLSDNGFSATPSPITLRFDEKFSATDLPTVSSNGYEFKGWYIYPVFSENAVSGIPCTKDTVLDMSIWNSLYIEKDGMVKLSDTYENGDESTYKFKIFAYWQINTYTVSVPSTSAGAEYVTSVKYESGKDVDDVKGVAQGATGSTEVNYGDFAIIDLVPENGTYINKITFNYGDSKTLQYTINWNSSNRTINIENEHSTLNNSNKVDFVENIMFIKSDYSEKINIRIIISFVKTNIIIEAESETQMYEVRFTDEVENETLFTTLVEYSKSIDTRLFVYPYRKGYIFEKYNLENKNGETVSNVYYIDKAIYYDTTIILTYTSSPTQKVNFYVWKESEYVLESVISENYILSSATESTNNFSIDESLVPIVDANGISVTMGNGEQLNVVGFTYGGVLLTLPAKNANHWPADTYLAGYIIADSAPASGYYTANMTGSVTNISSHTKYTNSFMVEEEINLYAYYDKPVFAFVSDSEIDSTAEFSVEGYTTADVVYKYVSQDGLNAILTTYSANKDLASAVNQHYDKLSSTTDSTYIYKIAYVNGTKNGVTYIYQVATTCYNIFTGEIIAI